MRNFRTYEIAVEFYKLSRGLGIQGNLREQLDRAASSIALNLAEGYGRASLKDQRRFFVIAMGSLRECQAILTLVDHTALEINSCADKLAAHLYKLIKFTP